MKHAAAPRVTGEVCLLLLLFCFFTPSLGNLWLLAAFPLALLICGIAAMRFERAVLRLLCCLPAALLLLAADGLVTQIILAACWLFAAIRFTVGHFSVEYWIYRREFIVMTVIAILASLFVAAGKMLNIITPPGVIGFAAASILLGIYSLRLIRLGALEEPGWSAYSALELLLPLGIAVGLSALLWLLVQALLYVLQWLAGLTEAPMPTAPPSTPNPYNHPIHYEPPPLSYGGGQYVMEEIPEPTPTPKPGAERVMHLLPPYIWLILIVVVLALAALLILLHLRKRKAAARKALDEEDEEAEEPRRFGRRRQSVPRSADRRIRAAYRSYLRSLQQQGQTIHNCDTSLDVQTAAEDRGSSPEALELRALYLIARYGDGGSLTAQDAERAETVLNSILSTG